jgi:hypothetical protein
LVVQVGPANRQNSDGANSPDIQDDNDRLVELVLSPKLLDPLREATRSRSEESRSNWLIYGAAAVAGGALYLISDSESEQRKAQQKASISDRNLNSIDAQNSEADPAPQSTYDIDHVFPTNKQDSMWRHLWRILQAFYALDQAVCGTSSDWQASLIRWQEMEPLQYLESKEVEERWKCWLKQLDRGIINKTLTREELSSRMYAILHAVEKLET